MGCGLYLKGMGSHWKAFAGVFPYLGEGYHSQIYIEKDPWGDMWGRTAWKQDRKHERIGMRYCSHIRRWEEMVTLTSMVAAAIEGSGWIWGLCVFMKGIQQEFAIAEMKGRERVKGWSLFQVLSKCSDYEVENPEEWAGSLFHFICEGIRGH